MAPRPLNAGRPARAALPGAAVACAIGDNADGVGLAIGHPAGLGHRRIACLLGALTTSHYTGWYAAYQPPPLTAVARAKLAIGARAVQVLLPRLARRARGQEWLPHVGRPEGPGDAPVVRGGAIAAGLRAGGGRRHRFRRRRAALVSGDLASVGGAPGAFLVAAGLVVAATLRLVTPAGPVGRGC